MINENRFKKAQESRKQEQTAIKKKLSDDASDNLEGKQATLMIYLPEQLKYQLKMYAVNQNRPVAVLLRKWIEEKLQENSTY